MGGGLGGVLVLHVLFGELGELGTHGPARHGEGFGAHFGGVCWGLWVCSIAVSQLWLWRIVLILSLAV